jgi:pyruvate, water dikinase
MIVSLADAEADTGGGKAGGLGALLRAGLPVPDGFVVPFAAYRAAVRSLNLDTPASQSNEDSAVRRAIEGQPLDSGLLDALARGLHGLGDLPVAVRSSAADEDTTHASAAGQHETVLAVHGLDAVADAVRACWASLHSPRAIAYRDGRPPRDPVMAVLVQRQVDAEVSGVMFTPTGPDDETRIEASWGLGPSIVEGAVTPDTYRIRDDGPVVSVISGKHTRLDRIGARLVTREVPAPDRDRPALRDVDVTRLARLGGKIAEVRGGAQDIEWAITGGRIWILQARPVTATPPPPRSGTQGTPPATLAGTPGSHGTATGTARVIHGPADFTRVRPGDILVCPYTDPAWTPLLRIAAGVVTETGGALSHAAIVAREHRIPAVLGIPGATRHIHDASTVTIDGAAGTVTTADA